MGRRALWCVAVLTMVTGIAGIARTRTVGPVDPDVLAVREAAWRAWFAGDDKTLGAMLPAEFLAIGARGDEIADRDKTLASSRAFKAGGGRLIGLSFADTHEQRYGDTVILYCRYEIVFESEGRQVTRRGRATEVFVRRDGRWIHPGWHLDEQP